MYTSSAAYASLCIHFSAHKCSFSIFFLALLQIGFPKELKNQPCCMAKQYQIEF